MLAASASYSLSAPFMVVSAFARHCSSLKMETASSREGSTPPAMVMRLNEVLRLTLTDAEMRRRFELGGTEVVLESTPETTAALVAEATREVDPDRAWTRHQVQLRGKRMSGDRTRRVHFHEEGPREGFQIEQRIYPLQQRAALVEALAETGLDAIQVASFVSPKAVPQMADSEALFAAIRRRPGIRHEAVWLNEQGFRRARATPGVDVSGRGPFSALTHFPCRTRWSCVSDQSCAEQVQLAAAIHLSAQQFQPGDVAFGLAVRPCLGQRGLDRRQVSGDTATERRQHARRRFCNPVVQRVRGPAAYHAVEAVDEASGGRQPWHRRFDSRHHGRFRRRQATATAQHGAGDGPRRRQPLGDSTVGLFASSPTRGPLADDPQAATEALAA